MTSAVSKEAVEGAVDYALAKEEEIRL